MGYYTKYQLIDVPEVMIDGLRIMSDNAKYALCEDGTTNQEAKWYNHEEDLIAFSKNCPWVLFILEGTGEVAGDYWRKYFKGGKMQRAKMKFSPFDEKELQ